ncbi:MAG: hypothetical protein AB7S94_07770 [Simkaniaceae bacterium]
MRKSQGERKRTQARDRGLLGGRRLKEDQGDKSSPEEKGFAFTNMIGEPPKKRTTKAKAEKDHGIHKGGGLIS